MVVTDILQPECVKVPLVATEKLGVIQELTDVLADHCSIRDREALKQAVWAREQTRTTGIGHGIGIPHGKCAGVDRLVMAVGKLDRPIEFGAIDGKPVDLIFLLASPSDQTGPHIQALAMISRMLTDASFRGDIKRCEDAGALYRLLAEHSTRQHAM
jgi:mannitol/fructose-specific phosphotransferase system IIA component (Ntr-type)